MKFCLFLLTSLISFVVTTPISAQITEQKIDSLMQRALAKLQVAGAAIVLVKDGQTVVQKGYGVTDIHTQAPVDDQTIFQIASNSKAFTSAALAMLVDAGKLTWEDKVIDHIPEFKMYNDYVTTHMNITDLLTHRSGLGLGAGDLMFFPDSTDFTVADVLQVFQHFQPESAFRTQFDYDNLLYIVAGEVIERVSGQPYESFIQQRILAPLGMTSSFIGSQPVAQQTNLAKPHSTTTGEMRRIRLFDNGLTNAAGGIYANVADMAKWLQLQLNQGHYSNGDSSLFSAENAAKMWTVHTPMAAHGSTRYQTHFSGYGLGWFLTDIRGNMVVSHSGGLPGMLSEVILIPDLKLGMVLLTNTEYGGGALNDAISRSIMDAYLGLDELPWIDKNTQYLADNMHQADEETTRVWAKVDSLQSQKIDTNRYLGSFQDNWFGDMQIYLKDDTLWMRSIRSPKLNGSMHFYEKDVFAVRWDYRDMECDVLATFEGEESGKATSIKLKGISPEIDFSFDFQDLNLHRITP